MEGTDAWQLRGKRRYSKQVIPHIPAGPSLGIGTDSTGKTAASPSPLINRIITTPHDSSTIMHWWLYQPGNWLYRLHSTWKDFSYFGLAVSSICCLRIVMALLYRRKSPEHGCRYCCLHTRENDGVYQMWVINQSGGIWNTLVLIFIGDARHGRRRHHVYHQPNCRQPKDRTCSSPPRR